MARMLNPDRFVSTLSEVRVLLIFLRAYYSTAADGKNHYSYCCKMYSLYRRHMRGNGDTLQARRTDFASVVVSASIPRGLLFSVASRHTSRNLVTPLCVAGRNTEHTVRSMNHGPQRQQETYSVDQEGDSNAQKKSKTRVGKVFYAWNSHDTVPFLVYTGAMTCSSAVCRRTFPCLYNVYSIGLISRLSLRFKNYPGFT